MSEFAFYRTYGLSCNKGKPTADISEKYGLADGQWYTYTVHSDLLRTTFVIAVSFCLKLFALECF